MCRTQHSDFNSEGFWKIEGDWKVVDAGGELPFLLAERDKIRHKVLLSLQSVDLHLFVLRKMCLFTNVINFACELCIIQSCFAAFASYGSTGSGEVALFIVLFGLCFNLFVVRFLWIMFCTSDWQGKFSLK